MSDPKSASEPVTTGWITLAHILRPQGRKGEVLADLLTDFPDSLTSGRPLSLAAPSDPGHETPRPVQVTGMWFPHGRNQGRVVLKVAGVDSISEADRLSGHDLVVPAADRVPLADGSFYISDLIGLRLISRGRELGTVTDVSFPTSSDGRRRLTEAAPLLVIQPPPTEQPYTEPAPAESAQATAPTPADEVLVPFVQHYLVRVDTAARIIEMDLPEGLIDLPADRRGESAGDDPA